jgi:hypothetical protein
LVIAKGKGVIKIRASHEKCRNNPAENALPCSTGKKTRNSTDIIFCRGWAVRIENGTNNLSVGPSWWGSSAPFYLGSFFITSIVFEYCRFPRPIRDVNEMGKDGRWDVNGLCRL